MYHENKPKKVVRKEVSIKGSTQKSGWAQTYASFIFLEGKAYLVGVFSRGDECGSFNQPGIYTNTLEYIDWITNNSKNSEC